MADDIRARRAERARQQKVRDLPRRAKRHLPLLAVAVLVIVGVGWAATHQPPGKKYVHEHAAFQWYVDGTPVSFRAAPYDFSAGFNDVVHMHTQGGPEGDRGDVLHIEGSYPGGTPDWSVKKIFEQYGMKVNPGDITFDTKDGHNGSRWADRGNATWHFLVSKVTGTSRGPFVDVTTLTGPDYTSYVPRDQDKLLMTYGDLSAAQLAQQEQAIPDASEWTGGGVTMPGG